MAATGKTTAKKKSTNTKKTESSAQPYRRAVGAVICFLMALMAFLCIFNQNAIILGFFFSFFSGALGIGYYALIVSFVLAGIILVCHKGRPVRFRVILAFAIPIFVAVFVHLFADLGWEIKFDLDSVKLLYSTGQTFTSGGVVGGLLSVGIVKLIGAFLTGLVTFLILLSILVTIFVYIKDTNVNEVIKAYKERPKPQYEKKEVDEAANAQRLVETVEKAVPKRAERPVQRVERPVQRVERPVQQVAVSKDNGRDGLDDFINLPVDDGPLYKSKKPEKSSLYTDGTRLNIQRYPAVEEDEQERPKPERQYRSVRDEPLTVPTEKQEKKESPKPEAAAPEPKPVKKQKVAEPVVPPTEKPEEKAQTAGEYIFPPLELLKSGTDEAVDATGEMQTNRIRLQETIKSFGINAKVVDVIRGPSVTLFELELGDGVRLNKLTNLSNDIALKLGATSVRIAAIPNRSSIVGVEVPNITVSTVYLRQVIGSKEFASSKSKVSFALGMDISGRNVISDISKMPHLLIAGTTGSGKSVCVNSMLISLLYRSTPEDVRLIMVDPKMVELGDYNGLPHLLIPVVTDPKKASGALQWAVTEMMRRYALLAENGVRQISEFNKLAAETPEMEKLPFIVIVIDELADLMMVAAKEVEDSICRIAQMGRAAGMHLIIATQRPSSNVITGLMKANIPSRIAFAVDSAMNSRIILDAMGAEKLVGKGDMLYSPIGGGRTRVQGCFVTDEEIEAVVSFIKKNTAPEYSQEIIEHIEKKAEETDTEGYQEVIPEVPEEYDELLPAAVDVIFDTEQASVSMLQRRLKLGYTRAARIMDSIEDLGIVGPSEGSKPRQIMITREQWLEMGLGGTVPTLYPEDEEEDEYLSELDED